MELREMRVAIMARYEPTAKLTREIESQGIEAVFQSIPVTERADLSNIYQSLEKCGGELLTPEDLHWPSALNDLEIAPIGLIVKGDVETISRKSLAIVGTRIPTPYGVRIASDFAAGFVDREWAIVSGGAYGIDSAAHKGALIAEGITIAITASGLDSPYPAGNQRLFDEIIESGAIVTEYLPGVTARPHRFLVRNRYLLEMLYLPFCFIPDVPTENEYHPSSYRQRLDPVAQGIFDGNNPLFVFLFHLHMRDKLVLSPALESTVGQW